MLFRKLFVAPPAQTHFMKPSFPFTLVPIFEHDEPSVGNGTSGTEAGAGSIGLTGAAAGCAGFTGLT